MSVSDGRALLLKSLSESEFRAQVITWAKRAGWLCSSMHDSRRQTWGTDRGIPDLIMARDGKVLFVELKRVGGKLSPAQVLWREALGGSVGGIYYVWTPLDEFEINVVLA